MIQTRLKWNLKKVQHYYNMSVIHIMRQLLLTIVYITSCFGLNDSFFEDMDNDLSGFKVYRANPKNVNQSNFLAELHNSSEVVFILFKKHWFEEFQFYDFWTDFDIMVVPGKERQLESYSTWNQLEYWNQWCSTSCKSGKFFTFKVTNAI